jgi:hypothetical protein
VAAVRVEVTRADIRQGVPRCGEDCAVSLALNRATDRAWFVTGRVAHSGGKRNGVSVRLPDAAVQWIAEFDDGRPVEPFAFDLELPP